MREKRIGALKTQCKSRPLPTPAAQIAIYSTHVEDDYGISPAKKHVPNRQISYFQNPVGSLILAAGEKCRFFLMDGKQGATRTNTQISANIFNY